MKYFLIAAFLSLLLSASCGVNQYTATTKAAYNAETGSWSYESNKNQENFEAKIGELKGKPVLEVRTTASTPEAAIAAALQSNLEISKQISALIQSILPLIQKAANVAATTGS